VTGVQTCALPIWKSFSIRASQEGFAELMRTLHARAATPGHTLVGLEVTGHFWENLEAFLSRAGYRVVVLNPVQTRYRDVLRRKAKTDDIDAYVIAGLLRRPPRPATSPTNRSRVCASSPACGRA